MLIVSLSAGERLFLERLVTKRVDARVIRRAQALVWLDDGDSVEETAERLHVSRQSIYNWLSRFEDRSGDDLLVRLADGIRAGRPPTALGIIDPFIDEIVDQDPRELGYRQTVWTAELLRRYLREAHQIQVSKRSVSRAIDRLGIVWKRPRHTLARRPETWRQAKGGSNAASRGGFGRSS